MDRTQILTFFPVSDEGQMTFGQGYNTAQF